MYIAASSIGRIRDALVERRCPLVSAMVVVGVQVLKINKYVTTLHNVTRWYTVRVRYHAAPHSATQHDVIKRRPKFTWQQADSLIYTVE
jgi:hypothetical protein